MPEKTDIKDRLRNLFEPVVVFLSYLGVSPLAVTIFGLLLSLVGAAFVARGALLYGGLVLIAAGVCDVLDGSLARRLDRVTSFGAFIDSTVDRITEIVYFGAMIFYFLRTGQVNSVLLFFILVALAGSFLTSYTRARAEGLGLDCRVGWLERPERITIIVLGLLLGRFVLMVVIVFLAFMTVFTFIQRILHVRRLTFEKNR